MFDESFLVGGNCFFIYANAKGEVSRNSIVNVSIRDGYLQGYSVSRRAFRTFRIDRILSMYHNEDDLNDAVIDGIDIEDEYTPPPARTTKSPKPKLPSGLEICFTGFDFPRKAELQDIAKKHNLSVKGSVTSKLYFLCIGQEPGWRKIEKATEKGAFIITEEHFLNFIETGEIPESSIEKGNTYSDDSAEIHEDFKCTFRTIRSSRRTPCLIALFEDGYALGWKFAVKETFKDALDIKYTQTILGNYRYHEWTQGSTYSFHRGDTFFSDKSAYGDWASFLKLPNAVAIQIKYEVYSGWETVAHFEGDFTGEYYLYQRSVPKQVTVPLQLESQQYDAGTVYCEIYIPNTEKTRLVLIKDIKLTQDELIRLLQTGTYWDIKHGMPPVKIDVFSLCAEQQA